MSEGVRLQTTQIFKRVSEQELNNSGKYHDSNSAPRILSNGWKLFQFWPSSVLSSSTVKMMQVVKLSIPSNGGNKTVIGASVLWQDSTQLDKV